MMVLPPGQINLERIEIESPISGFLSIYDGDDLVCSIPVCPPVTIWPFYWTLTEGLSTQWDSSENIIVKFTISGTVYEREIGEGRQNIFTLVEPTSEEETENNVRIVANLEETQAEIERSMRAANIVGDAVRGIGQAIVPAVRATTSAFQGFSNAIGNMNRSINLADLQESSSSGRAQIIQPNIFDNRPKDLKRELLVYLDESSKDIQKLNKNFLWKTKDAEMIKIWDMKSSHIYHSMRLIYRKTIRESSIPINWRIFTTNRDSETGDTFTSIQAYNPPPPYARTTIAYFIWHLEERKDLPTKLLHEYSRIVASIVGVELPELERQGNFGRLTVKSKSISDRKIIDEQLIKEPIAKEELIALGLVPGNRRITID